MYELKKIRKELGLTIKEMAESIGISKSFYEKIETGKRNISSNFAIKLKEKYPEVDLNIFLQNNNT